MIIIFFALFGISLIGTFIQNKIPSWKNSQNIFFGCLGALIAYLLNLSLVEILISWLLCTIISFFVFKTIGTKIFDIKSDKVNKVIITIGGIIASGGMFILLFHDFNISKLQKPFNITNIIINIVFPVFIIISYIKGISMFVKAISEFDQNKHKQ